ncbi:MAG: hypothetical protein ACOZBZ_00305 [Patescibacteria group bacterium]
MELPNIIDKITHPEEKAKKEYFWALQIWDEGVKSAIWTVEEEKTKVVALGSHEAWEDGVEELTIAVDKSLSTASERFVGEGGEPSKVIFGLPEDWTLENKIKPEYQEKLSALCQKLELEPVGFVSTFDALNHHLKDVEGTPASAILISPGRTKVTLAIVEVGKIKGVEQIVRSENLAADVCEGLLRFTGIEILPSRMLLFNGEDMEEARQVLIGYQWQTFQIEGKRLPFLHFPKIEILPYDFDITAVSLAGGKEVAKSLGFKVISEPKKEVEPSRDLGFVKGKDVASEFKAEVVPVPEEPTFAPPQEEKPKPTLGLLKEKLSTIHLPSLPALPVGMPLVTMGVGIILLILGAVVVFWWNVPKAQVTIYVTPQALEKGLELTVDPNQEVVDEKNFILPAQVIETQETGEKTAPTTGEKTVGEHARGEVTVYNRTDSKKIFAEGTIIVGPGNLKFTLDRETTVASKTPDLASGVDKWGETKTAVTAVDIGAQYNLASSSQFSFKDFPTSSYLAKNESAFIGGTSRQIQAVSEKDQKDLLVKLSQELTEKGKMSLLSKVSSGKKLIEEILAQPVSTNFDHKVGDEAQTLALNLTVKVTGLTFTDEDLAFLAQKLISGSIPQDFELKKEEITARFEIKKKNEDGSILFKTIIKANLLPKLDKEEIIKNIKGKYPDLAKKYLSSLSGYADSEIILSPRLPGILGTIPRRENKITLEIRSK